MPFQMRLDNADSATLSISYIYPTFDAASLPPTPRKNTQVQVRCPGSLPFSAVLTSKSSDRLQSLFISSRNIFYRNGWCSRMLQLWWMCVVVVVSSSFCLQPSHPLCPPSPQARPPSLRCSEWRWPQLPFHPPHSPFFVSSSASASIPFFSFAVSVWGAHVVITWLEVTRRCYRILAQYTKNTQKFSPFIPVPSALLCLPGCEC